MSIYQIERQDKVMHDWLPWDFINFMHFPSERQTEKIFLRRLVSCFVSTCPTATSPTRSGTRQAQVKHLIGWAHYKTKAHTYHSSRSFLSLLYQVYHYLYSFTIYSRVNEQNDDENNNLHHYYCSWTATKMNEILGGFIHVHKR